MNIALLTLGEVEVYALPDGLLSVDGGAMFGVVPKTIWARHFPADEDNLIAISLNSFLIKTEGRVVLVETGVGETLEGPLGQSYRFERGPGLGESLRELGLLPADVDLVINTHLHFDHCGGNTRRGPKGVFDPAFPRAEYVIQKGEWQTALNPPERERSSYLAETFLPLQDRDQVRLVEGRGSVCPGVEVLLTPGHTRFHQCVKVESRDRVLVILGDLVPTTAHVRFSYVMSYDLYPLETMANKKAIFERGLAGSWFYGFVHDPAKPFGRVGRLGGKYALLPAEGAGRGREPAD